MASIQALLYVTAGTQHTWNGVLAWNVVWVTGLATPAVGLLAGAVALRDRAGRDGGTSWRPVNPLAAAGARWCAMAVAVLVMDLLAVVPVLLVGAGMGRPPVVRVVLTALVVALGGVAMLPVWDGVARRWGLFASTACALGWGVAGVLSAETSHWWLLPFGWPIRAVLPLLGAHANGTLLPPDDPIAVASPAPAIGLTVGLLIVVCAAAAVIVARQLPVQGSYRIGRRVAPSLQGAGLRAIQLPLIRRQGPRPQPGVRPGRSPWAPSGPQTAIAHRHGSPARALSLSLRNTGLAPLAAGAIAVQVGAVVIWHSSSYSSLLFEVITLPVVAGVMPVLVWSTIAPAWRALAIRPVRPGRLSRGLRIAVGGYVVGFALVSSGIELWARVSQAHFVRVVVISVTLGLALMGLHLWLAVRFSTLVSVAVLGIGMLVSLLTGVSNLASDLWMWGPWTWAGIATTTDDPRQLVIMWVACVVLLAITGPLTARAGRRYAASAH
jgi:hypothetical protein